MYWIYVLQNINKKWYIGYTSNLKRRLSEHKGKHGSKTTSRSSAWNMIYCEGYRNKYDALSREKFLKSGSGRKFLKKQMSNYLTTP